MRRCGCVERRSHPCHVAELNCRICPVQHPALLPMYATEPLFYLCMQPSPSSPTYWLPSPTAPLCCRAQLRLSFTDRFPPCPHRTAHAARTVATASTRNSHPLVSSRVLAIPPCHACLTRRNATQRGVGCSGSGALGTTAAGAGQIHGTGCQACGVPRKGRPGEGACEGLCVCVCVCVCERSGGWASVVSEGRGGCCCGRGRAPSLKAGGRGSNDSSPPLLLLPRGAATGACERASSSACAWEDAAGAPALPTPPFPESPRSAASSISRGRGGGSCCSRSGGRGIALMPSPSKVATAATSLKPPLPFFFPPTPPAEDEGVSLTDESRAGAAAAEEVEAKREAAGGGIAGAGT